MADWSAILASAERPPASLTAGVVESMLNNVLRRTGTSDSGLTDSNDLETRPKRSCNTANECLTIGLVASGMYATYNWNVLQAFETCLQLESAVSELCGKNNLNARDAQKS